VLFLPVLLLFISFYKTKFKKLSLPLTEKIGRRVVTLPLHPLLKESDVDYIISKIKQVLPRVLN